MYRSYDQKVPDFLRKRPKSVVQHILKRAYPEYPSSFVERCGQCLFMVKSESSDERYQVWLGSDTHLPSCQCIYYKTNRLPCKHLCAVVNLPDVGWKSLGSSFQNHPLFSLDAAIVTDISRAQQTATQYATGDNNHNPILEQHVPDNFGATAEREPLPKESHIEYNKLKNRKRGMEINVRGKCVSTLKALNDEQKLNHKGQKGIGRT